MTETRAALKELQRMDQKIAAHRATIRDFDPKFEEVEGPVLQLESEVEALHKRLKETRVEARRIEGAADDKRDRSKKLQERLNEVRTVREEAAVHAELEMVRRALEGDETEALSLLDQVRRMEERLAELESDLQDKKAEVDPMIEALVAERDSAKGDLEGLVAERDAFAESITDRERRMYEQIMGGAGRTVAVAELTVDGACGNCFTMIPLQLASRIRHSEELIRCEGCGVILTPDTGEEAEAEGGEIAADGLDTGSSEDVVPEASDDGGEEE